MKHYSIIIPSYNEEKGIVKVLEEILANDPQKIYEVIVVDDCSTDGTAEAVGRYPVRLLKNVQNFGYGYSLKCGISVAQHDNIIIIDADGSYPISALPGLIKEYEKGFDMVIGARQGMYYQGSFAKRLGRFCFGRLSEFATGRKIPDINSGCRVFRKDLTLRFFHTLSSGFSFTTTITLAFMLNAHSVRYIPIEYNKRTGSSKVRYMRDTLRAAQIIVEAIVFYNPIKIYILGTWTVLVAGIVCIPLSYFFPMIGLIVFLTITSIVMLLAIGFLAVFLKFMHSAPTSSRLHS
jgi:glycosyltransferase involved in cell wall biosynthesis